MTAEQTDNISIITAALNKFGITNKFMQAAILATVSKESNFIPKRENLNYSKANILRVWPKVSDADATRLANNPQALGDFMYGGKYGNAANEGYKYRGGGFNQITFKNAYKSIGDKIGQDLVSNPDLLNNPKIAADALAAFFAPEIVNGFKSGSFGKFGVTDLNQVNDTTIATKIAVQINAGRGTDFNNAIVQEGYNKAVNIVDSLLQSIKDTTVEGVVLAKKHWLGTTLIITGVLGISIALILKK